MTKWALSRIEGHVKGRIAEAIVESMFRASGVPITHFGYQYRTMDFIDVDAIDDWGDPRYDEVRHRTSLTPDFIIRNCNGMHELIEVKYAQQGRLSLGDLKKVKAVERFWSPKLVIVSHNPNFRKIKIPPFLVVYPPYQFDKERNPIVRREPLDERVWGITEEAFQECIRLKNILFEAVLTSRQRKI